MRGRRRLYMWKGLCLSVISKSSTPTAIFFDVCKDGRMQLMRLHQSRSPSFTPGFQMNPIHSVYSASSTSSNFDVPQHDDGRDGRAVQFHPIRRDQDVDDPDGDSVQFHVIHGDQVKRGSYVSPEQIARAVKDAADLFGPVGNYESEREDSHALDESLRSMSAGEAAKHQPMHSEPQPQRASCFDRLRAFLCCSRN
jgi:hypothetical protein